MLNYLYKLPKFILISFLIAVGIFFILKNDPPHTFCDTQLEHFKKIQTGILYTNPKDFHKESSTLERKKILCQKENTLGSCYDYFRYLRHLLKDLNLLSKECRKKLYQKDTSLKKAFSKALSLMTLLAWRQEVLTGKVSRYNWLGKSDLFLFCDLKKNYIINFGEQDYKDLEQKILMLLAFDNKKFPLHFVKKQSLLAESCINYNSYLQEKVLVDIISGRPKLS